MSQLNPNPNVYGGRVIWLGKKPFEMPFDGTTFYWLPKGKLFKRKTTTKRVRVRVIHEERPGDLYTPSGLGGKGSLIPRGGRIVPYKSKEWVKTDEKNQQWWSLLYPSAFRYAFCQKMVTAAIEQEEWQFGPEEEWSEEERLFSSPMVPETYYNKVMGGIFNPLEEAVAEEKALLKKKEAALEDREAALQLQVDEMRAQMQQLQEIQAKQKERLVKAERIIADAELKKAQAEERKKASAAKAKATTTPK